MGHGTDTMERTRDRGKRVEKMVLDSDEIANRKAKQNARRIERRDARRVKNTARREAAAVDIEEVST